MRLHKGVRRPTFPRPLPALYITNYATDIRSHRLKKKLVPSPEHWPPRTPPREQARSAFAGVTDVSLRASECETGLALAAALIQVARGGVWGKGGECRGESAYPKMREYFFVCLCVWLCVWESTDSHTQPKHTPHTQASHKHAPHPARRVDRGAGQRGDHPGEARRAREREGGSPKTSGARHRGREEPEPTGFQPRAGRTAVDRFMSESGGGKSTTGWGPRALLPQNG
jgi:hypothetical protein